VSQIAPYVASSFGWLISRHSTAFLCIELVDFYLTALNGCVVQYAFRELEFWTRNIAGVQLGWITHGSISFHEARRNLALPLSSGLEQLSCFTECVEPSLRARRCIYRYWQYRNKTTSVTPARYLITCHVNFYRLCSIHISGWEKIPNVKKTQLFKMQQRG